MTEQFKRAFDNKDEFMKFYEEHKEEIDKLQTKELNKQFKINSCKISRNKNKIVVRAESPKKKTEKKDKEVKPQNLNKVIDHLINEFEKQLNELYGLKKSLTSQELKNKIVSNDLFESKNPKDE